MAAAPQNEITLYVHYHTPVGTDDASFTVNVPADEDVNVITLTSDILKNIPVDGYIFKYWMDGAHIEESTIYSVDQVIEIPTNDLHLYGFYEPIVKQKNVKARYQQKIDTEANWNKAVNFIPMKGEIIIYQKDENYSYDRIKIGDGITVVTDLTFIQSAQSDSTDIVVTPQKYGAVGDGVHDDTEAIQIALNDHTDIYIPSGTYKISAPLVVWQRHTKLHCEGTLLLESDISAIRITSSNNDIYVRKIMSSGNIGNGIQITGYRDSSSVGASVYNNIEVGQISGVNNGIWLNPNGVGIAYTNVQFKEIIANRGIYFDPMEISGSFINENVFTGGCLSGSIPIASRKNGAIDPFNGNKFNNVSLEFCTEPMDLQFFQYNHFNHCRFAKWENYSRKLVTLDASSYGNIFNYIGLVFVEQIEDNNDYLVGNTYDGFIRYGIESDGIELGRKGYSYRGNIIIKDEDRYDDFTSVTDSLDLSAIPYSIEGRTFSCISPSNDIEIKLSPGYGYYGASFFYISAYMINDKTITVKSGDRVIATVKQDGIYKIECHDSADWVVSAVNIKPDWNQSDETAVDYIKNKPFGSVYTEEDILEETTITQFVNVGGLVTTPPTGDISKDLTYQVTYNGTLYNCVAYEGNFQGITVVALGNGTLVGKPSEEPFGVVFVPPEMVSGFGAYVVVTPFDGATQITISISGLSETIYKIDNKYIQHNNSYIVNGSQTGSLRTIGAAPEQENDYTAGYMSFAEGESTRASGRAAHAEGCFTSASGNYSHAEGYDTVAEGNSSHAEGYQTHATDNYAHAEGYKTFATYMAHAEGYETTANGNYSHTEGFGTYTNEDIQHVQGKYNIIDNSSTYAHIVGNGSSDSKRSNAHTLDWNGNAWFAGQVSVGSSKATLVDTDTMQRAFNEANNDVINYFKKGAQWNNVRKFMFPAEESIFPAKTLELQYWENLFPDRWIGVLGNISLNKENYYQVILNDVIYELPVEMHWLNNDYNDAVFFLGNGSFIDNDEMVNVDIPFCISIENVYDSDGREQWDNIIANIAIKYEEGQTYTLEIKHAKNKNYLPSELLEFTTCTQKTLLPLMTISQSGTDGNFVPFDYAEELASATNLDIYVDNTLYVNQSMVRSIWYDGDIEEEFYYVGNASLVYPNEPNTGEDFFLVVAYGNQFAVTFRQSEDETATHTLAIVSKNYTIKEEYLPHSMAEDLEVITLLLDNDMLPVLMEDENTIIAEKDGTMLLI